MPLANPAERMLAVYQPINSGALVYYGDSLANLHDNIAAVQPTVVFSAPVLWERFAAAIKAKLGNKVFARRSLFLVLLKKNFGTGAQRACFQRAKEAEKVYWLLSPSFGTFVHDRHASGHLGVLQSVATSCSCRLFESFPLRNCHVRIFLGNHCLTITGSTMVPTLILWEFRLTEFPFTLLRQTASSL